MGEKYDTIIIGGGPAGLAAAIYAVRKNLKVLMVTKNIGGQAALSSDIENYLGFSLISGAELAAKFRADLEKFEADGVTVKEGLEVVNISGQDPNFTVTTTDGQSFNGKTVIIASGRTPRMLGIPGEKEFLGRGVATCATCDGPLFKGKDVVVVGGGNSAMDAAFSLMKVARTVNIVCLSEDIEGDEVLKRNVKNAPNVKIFTGSHAVQVSGNQFVTSLKIANEAGEEQTLEVQGIFVEIGWIPSTNFDALTHKNKTGEIMVDEFGATTIPGIYAAGDVNDLWGEQIIIAAGEGAKVALSVAEHLSKTPHQHTSNMHEG